MIAWLVGVVLLPSAVLTFGLSLRALAALAVHSPSALPFLAGFLATAGLWLAGRLARLPARGPAAWFGTATRWVYVFGHELTHALAAWSMGGKLLGFKVGASGGFVDLSSSNAFISLAPYCFPLYTAAAVLAYRLLLWAAPEAGLHAPFLALVGLTLSFHLLKTLEVLWDRRQPDVAAAGGAVFSAACILLANGLVLLLLVSLLFPAGASLLSDLALAARLTAEFWKGVYAFLDPVRTSFVAQMQRP